MMIENEKNDRLKKWAKGNKFNIASAFHKAVRKGDIQHAIFWGELSALARGASYVKNYTKNLMWEETRNLALFLKWNNSSPADWRDMVSDVCRSRKKWECECRVPIIGKLVEADLFAKEKMSGPLFQQNVIEMAKESTNIDELYKLSCSANFGSKEVFLQVMDSLIERCGFDVEVADKLRKHDIEILLFLAEKLSGHWHEECNEMFDVESFEPLEIEEVEFPADIYDGHTRDGNEKLLAYWPDIGPGKPAPNGIDLRWSGMYLGIWRDYAFSQFGMDYKNTRWEEVEIPEDVWKTTVRADQIWFSVYKRIKKKYGKII